jgi:8-oxo-dGTP pyrophosphatase MutT (NUDIX family)
MNKIKNNYRKAVFVVAYAKNYYKKIEYLLLKRKLHWVGWEFPKGGIEKGEEPIETAKRELIEESGLQPLRIIPFHLRGEYKYKKILPDRPKIIGQNYILFAAEVNKAEVKFDKREHSGFVWANFKQSKKKLTWPNQRKSLRIVNRYLINKKIKIKN